MWTVLAGIIPIIRAILSLFGAGIDRQEQVEKNMTEWFKRKINAGGEIAEAQTEQEQQASELAAMRGKKPDPNAKPNP